MSEQSFRYKRGEGLSPDDVLCFGEADNPGYTVGDIVDGLPITWSQVIKRTLYIEESLKGDVIERVTRQRHTGEELSKTTRPFDPSKRNTFTTGAKVAAAETVTQEVESVFDCNGEYKIDERILREADEPYHSMLAGINRAIGSIAGVELADEHTIKGGSHGGGKTNTLRREAREFVGFDESTSWSEQKARALRLLNRRSNNLDEIERKYYLDEREYDRDNPFTPVADIKRLSEMPTPILQFVELNLEASRGDELADLHLKIPLASISFIDGFQIEMNREGVVIRPNGALSFDVEDLSFADLTKFLTIAMGKTLDEVQTGNIYEHTIRFNYGAAHDEFGIPRFDIAGNPIVYGRHDTVFDSERRSAEITNPFLDEAYRQRLNDAEHRERFRRIYVGDWSNIEPDDVSLTQAGDTRGIISHDETHNYRWISVDEHEDAFRRWERAGSPTLDQVIGAENARKLVKHFDERRRERRANDANASSFFELDHIASDWLDFSNTHRDEAWKHFKNHRALVEHISRTSESRHRLTMMNWSKLDFRVVSDLNDGHRFAGHQYNFMAFYAHDTWPRDVRDYLLSLLRSPVNSIMPRLSKGD